MLRPQDNALRESKKLDGLWDFVLDSSGAGRSEQWWHAALPDSRKMPVPASYNDLILEPGSRDHVGDVWYQRRVFVPRGWQGQRVVLRFDAATHRASVWLDDEQVVEHEGGYTPFEVDVTRLIRPGQAVRLTVAVNNELSYHSLPPGLVETRPDGSRRQHYFHDFFNFAGLHRSVWLYMTPSTYIADLTVTTDIEGSSGVVRCTTVVEGGAGEMLRLQLVDAEGRVVAEGEGSEAVLRVPDVKLWRPGDGYLYELTVDVVGDAIVDRYVLPVGVRTVRVDGARFLINDEPFSFRGFGMHEDHDVRGRGHEDVAMVHDFELLKWVGANSFRTSHYPYAEEVLDHADRLGLVVIGETAAVGLNLSVSESFHFGGKRATFSEDTIGSRAQAAHRRAIEELVARDKNHPSVVLWSIANEPETSTDEARAYFEPLFEVTRKADPTRPVGLVNAMAATATTCLVTELADVVMVNRYYGWYVAAGDLTAAEQSLEADLSAWQERYGKPIIVTEYGADAVSGLHSTRAAVWSEEFQAALLDTYHRVFDRCDAVVGEHVWNFADFATTQHFIRVDGNKKGVFTHDRRPKAAAFALRRRWHGNA